MSSFKKWIPIFGIVLFLFLLVAGCSRSGSLKSNQPPSITITSYGGTDTLSTDPELFQQKIFWEAHDVDGVVKFYAYRVLDQNENPIATSGHMYIDDNGWVYHYKDGVNVDENTPTPDTPGYGTIWTRDVYALINFPAHNTEGDSAIVKSIFEVKCMDNRGAESNIARKYFTASSRKPEILFDDKDKINGKTVGQGIYLEFDIRDLDLGLNEGDRADHFEFMLKKRSSITGEYIPTEGYNQWYSIYKHKESYYYEISRNTTPALSPNTYNSIYNTFQDSTILVYRAVDLAGIKSDPDSVVFASKEGFHPGSLIYESQCYALGKYHYSLVSQGDQVVPSYQNASGTIFYAIPPFTDLQSEKALIGSNDLKIYMKWGWHGEYAGDDPSAEKKNIVKDEDTNTDYFTKIKAFLVRLDNKPLYLPYLLADDGDNLYVDENGKEWLYIPSSHYNFQNVILTRTTLEYSTGNLYGVHKFEVKALDIQGIADPSPAEYIFKVEKFTPKEERTGILVLDNEANTGGYAKIDTLYEEMLSDYLNQTTIIYTMQDPNYKNKISITDYLKYKLIILHSENLIQNTEETKLKQIFNTFQMYLDFGGNLVISGGSNLKKDIQFINEQGLGYIFSKYFGIEMPSSGNDESYAVDVYSDITGTPSDFLNLQFFIGANAVDNNFSNIDFDYESSKNIVGIIGNEVVNPKHALGPVACIATPDQTSEPIYTFKSIPAGDGPKQPTESQYAELSNLVVGQKKITETNKCYLFTFPLSYMNVEQGKVLMNKIISEVLGQ